MASKNTNLSVRIDPHMEFGLYANAFRVLDADMPDKVFLEFLLYSPTVNRALLVARVRVSRKLLPTMVSTLKATLDLISLDRGDFH